MSYRILCAKMIGTFTGESLAFLQQNAGLPFAETIELCRQNGFMYPAGMKPEFERLGNEVVEVLVDAPILQNKWRQENGLPVSDIFDKEGTFLTQIKKFQPDIVYFQTFNLLAPEVRRRIKEQCPSVQLVAGHRGYPLFDATGFEDVDAVFLGHTKFHDVWHKVGVKTFFNLHGFDADLAEAIHNNAHTIQPIEFSFIGHTGWGSGPHDGRYFDLRKVMEKLPLTIYGHEPKLSPPIIDRLSPDMRVKLRQGLIETLKFSPDLGLRAAHRFGRITRMPKLSRLADAAMRHKKFGPPPAPPKMDDCWWYHEPPISKLYPARMHTSQFGIGYHALLAASKLTWNRHQDTPGAGANMRLFEACGLGVCQLVDARDEVTACYEPGAEIVTYDSIDDCIEKAKWLLNNPTEREKIAKAGQQRTMKDHTIRQRVQEIHTHLVDLLAIKRGGVKSGRAA